MTKIITAILAMGCIMLGVGISATSCPAMAAQPQQEWTQRDAVSTAQPVHKKPVVQAHKAAPKASTKPGSVEVPAPVVCPVLPSAPVATPTPPPAPREPSYWERAKANAYPGNWLLWPLGGLVIGGAITIIINAGRKVYAGYKASKAVQ